MEDFLKGMLWGAGIGLAVGAISVAKNRKLAKKINDGMNMAEEKLVEAKDLIEEKIEDCKEKCDESQEYCCGDELKREFSKKSKK